MKIYVHLACFYAVMSICYGQVGIFTDEPQGSLDLNAYLTDGALDGAALNGENMSMGLVLPTVGFIDGTEVLNTSTGVTTTVPGTLIYDSTSQGLRVFRRIGGWSNPISNQGVVTIAQSGSTNINCDFPTIENLALNMPSDGAAHTIRTNFSSTGRWSVSTPVVNGVTFFGSGEITATGVQNIEIIASGTPTSTGIHFITVDLPGISNSCTFRINVQ